MNIKTIIVGSLAIGLAVGSAFLNINQEEKSVYTPRTLENGMISGAAGYIEYMHTLRMDPNTGEIDFNYVQQVRNEIAARAKMNNKAALGINWLQQGPDDIGGRTRALLVDKYNSNIVYAGSVGGGLFVSNDGANTWTPVAGHMGTSGECLAVSCLTQTDNGRIFFGTGHDAEGSNGNGRGTEIGNGVYEYVPSTGMVLPVVTNSTAVPNNIQGSFWSFCNSIASIGNRLYLGTRDGMVYADPDVNGFYPTTFAGWFNPIETFAGFPETGTVKTISTHPDGSIIVAFSGTIYAAPNDGNYTVGPFTKKTIGMGAARSSAAVAPSNSNWMYFVSSNGVGVMATLQISTDKGVTWTEIVPGGSGAVDPMRRTATDTDGQGGWDQCIAVNPADAGNILVGGIRLFEWQYNPSSNPIGGSWLLAASEFGSSISNPFYVHADKHVIAWSTANTVYIGSDGGVGKSNDGASTWQEKNLGYNVTTFYDATMLGNGWLLGGAQDNGDLLMTYQAFGELSPLGTTPIQPSDGQTFGDGFDVASSAQAGGIIYGTAQNGALWRTSQTSAGGGFFDGELADMIAAGQPFNTCIENWESNYDSTSVDSIMVTFTGPDTLLAGQPFEYTSLTNGVTLNYFPPTTMFVDSTDTLMLQDYIQNRFALATNQGIYLTRDAARLNAINTEWNRISTPLGAVYCMEFSADGNHLFIGTSGGVRRISGLNLANDSLGLDVRSCCEVITNPSVSGSGTAGIITGISADPNDIDNLIVTTGGYGSGTHVYRCTNATTGMNFTSIMGSGATSLPGMPVYDPEIDMNDKDKVIIGTDFGVWTTDNAFSAIAGSLVQWTDESGNVGHVPVMSVDQLYKRGYDNLFPGRIVLGTHGRGFYITDDLMTGIEENNDFLTNANNGFVSNLNVYPNPINNIGMVNFDLNKNSKAVIKIYNLVGKLVKTIDLGTKPKGNHKVQFNVSELSVGSYILSLEAGSEKSIAKFIVTR